MHRRSLGRLALGPALLVALLVTPASAPAQPAAPSPPQPSNPSTPITPGGSPGSTASPSTGTTTAPVGTPSGTTGTPTGSGYTAPFSLPVGGPPPLIPADGFTIPDQSTATVRGNDKGYGIIGGGGDVAPSRIPGLHVVRRGDTLWDITGHYYRNPWMWPKVWSYNPQVQNPHWIYPGDQLRLRNDGGDDRTTQTVGEGTLRRQSVQPDTVFLRDTGFIDDARRDVWGVLSGSPEDRMMLADGNVVYLDIKDNHEPKVNQELTIFRPARSVGKGAVVEILGTVRVESYDADKKLARGRIIESLDVIERGANVGPLGRRFDVVAPARNKNDVVAHVTYSIVPLVFHARDQVVFLDKGSDDGLVPGNRLFILRRGDGWRPTLQGSGDLSDKRIRYTEQLGPETESILGTK
ncbi:MAG: LysM peptidoglycan-binding domain-containing protein, partial [Myxococcales bacterium]